MGRVTDYLVGQDIFGFAIGVHYKGSGTYQTKLGALFTMITYILMLVNLVTLLQAFFDGSKQEEKSQTTFVDKFLTDAHNLVEEQFGIVIMSYPPMPENVGSLKAIQRKPKVAGEEYRELI